MFFLLSPAALMDTKQVVFIAWYSDSEPIGRTFSRRATCPLWGQGLITCRNHPSVGKFATSFSQFLFLGFSQISGSSIAVWALQNTTIEIVPRVYWMYSCSLHLGSNASADCIQPSPRSSHLAVLSAKLMRLLPRWQHQTGKQMCHRDRSATAQHFKDEISWISPPFSTNISTNIST